MTKVQNKSELKWVKEIDFCISDTIVQMEKKMNFFVFLLLTGGYSLVWILGFCGFARNCKYDINCSPAMVE